MRCRYACVRDGRDSSRSKLLAEVPSSARNFFAAFCGLVDESGIQGDEQVRTQGEWYATSILCKIEISRQFTGNRYKFAADENERKTRQGRQRLAAYPGGEIDTRKVGVDCANRAHAIHAELQPTATREGLEPVKIIEHTGRSLAVDRPKPSYGSPVRDHPFDFGKVEGCAPRNPMGDIIEPEPIGVVYKSFAELAVGKQEPRLTAKRQLRSHHVIGKGT